jgi:hypothetical protein
MASLNLNSNSPANRSGRAAAAAETPVRPVQGSDADLGLVVPAALTPAVLVERVGRDWIPNAAAVKALVEFVVAAKAPPPPVQGVDADLGLSFTVAGLEGYLAKMQSDEAFLVTAELVGQPIPKTAAAAAALLATLEAKGGDFVDEFKAPVVCRVLKDGGVDWAAEGADGGRLFELVGRFLNGYDGLAWARQRPEYAACSVCAHEAARGNPNVGPATVFISWGLVSTFASLIGALKKRVEEGLLEPTACLWVCDTCIRQHEGEAKQRDVGRLDEMVRLCRSTLLFNDVWDRTVKR